MLLYNYLTCWNQNLFFFFTHRNKTPLWSDTTEASPPLTADKAPRFIIWIWRGWEAVVDWLDSCSHSDWCLFSESKTLAVYRYTMGFIIHYSTDGNLLFILLSLREKQQHWSLVQKPLYNLPPAAVWSMTLGSLEKRHFQSVTNTCRGQEGKTQWEDQKYLTALQKKIAQGHYSMVNVRGRWSL